MATGNLGSGLEVMEPDAALRPGYPAPSCTLTGRASSAVFAPDGYSLWLVVAQLDAGAKVEWSAAHGDEGVYVATGALTVDGTTCDAGGAVIVESGVPAEVRAEEATGLVHVGSTSAVPSSGGLFGPPAADGHGVHVLSGHQLAPIEVGSISHVYYADSTCPTCRIAFFRIDSSDDYASPSHAHSQDEIIHVLSGSLQFGRRTVGPGTSVAIPAERRYGFRSTEAFSFLNYRANGSSVTMAPGTPAFEESARAVRKLAERQRAQAPG